MAVRIRTPGAVHPVAIEYQAPDSVNAVDLSDGEGYLSSDGRQWVSAEQKQQCNLCLKAYTVEPADHLGSDGTGGKADNGGRTNDGGRSKWR